jgi:hypothetical protein
MDVLTNSPKESGNGDVAARPTNIVNQNEGKFKVSWVLLQKMHLKFCLFHPL